MSSGRNRKFLRIELTKHRLVQLERWAAYLYNRGLDSAPPVSPVADFSHLASALLDSALDERMQRLERTEAIDVIAAAVLEKL